MSKGKKLKREGKRGCMSLEKIHKCSTSLIWDDYVNF
jgi:hypothetical protein